jgi:hypothetical protein
MGKKNIVDIILFKTREITYIYLEESLVAFKIKQSCDVGWGWKR